VLHFSSAVLPRSETFVQQRLYGQHFRPVVAGWERVADGLEVPCPSVILPRRFTWGDSRSLAVRIARRAARPLNLARQKLDIVGLLVRSAPGIVHAHFGTVGIGVAAACELLRIPLVTSFYGFDVGSLPRELGGASAYARLFGTAAALTAEGPALARTLVHLGAPREKIKLLPLTLPEFLLNEPQALGRDQDGSFNLLQIARFVEKKGIDVTLRALAVARRAGVDARLVLVGDGPLRAEVESLIGDLNLGGAVTRPGFLAHRELAKYFAWAHAYVQPSRTAANGDTEGGYPTTLIEAQARGVPVLATIHADIPLVVRHGVTGLLCAENDHEALARHIVRLANEPQTLTAMAGFARRVTVRRHHPTTVRSLQERVYREAIRRFRLNHRPFPFLPSGRVFRDPFDDRRTL
jgi:colanic acid/amylovoran biosynthesis glycosyltransferase